MRPSTYAPAKVLGGRIRLYNHEHHHQTLKDTKVQTLTQNTNTDGFPYVVETHTSPVETELIACENASQVLATIVDGYTELNDDEALKSPITLIEDQVLPLVNERVYSDYLEKNGFARLAPADEEVLLSREKDSFGHIDWQLADIPLAAASTQFAPFTEALSPRAMSWSSTSPTSSPSSGR